MIKNYSFYKHKYGSELLIDIVDLESLQKHFEESPIHTLSYYDISVIENGSGTFSIDGRCVPVCKGQVIFSAPMQIREWRCESMPMGKALIFEPEFLCSFFNDPLFVRRLPYFSGDMPSMQLDNCEYDELMPILQTIRTEIARQEHKDQHILRALLYHATMLLRRMYESRTDSKSTKMPNHYLIEFSKLLDKHVALEHSVEFYAGLLCITPGHLNDLSRQGLGISAKQYILERLLTEAKRMLCYSGKEVAEIADQLNFDTPSYFVRLFKQKTKMTPLQYRTQFLEK